MPSGPPLPHGCETGAGALLDRLSADRAFPLTVMVALTERCPLRCGHCFIPPPGPEDRMPLARWFALLEELSELGVLFLVVTGGEPGVSTDLLPFVAGAARLRFAVRLKTAAVQWSPAGIDALVDAGVGQADVSLHHPDPGPHDAFVGRAGAWATTLAAARRLRDRGCRVRITTVAMGWNVAALPRLLDLCRSEDLPYAIDACVGVRTDGDLAAVALRPDEAALRALLQDPRMVSVEGLRQQPRTPRRGRLCAAGQDGPYVGPSGEVRLCQGLPLALGSVARRSFREVWLGSPERRRFLDLDWSALPECSRCALSWTCGRCPATALLETGDLLGISPPDCLRARVLRGIADGTEGGTP